MASSVIVFGPTGQVGSVVARTAAEQGVDVWLAMRDPTKNIRGIGKDQEDSASFRRIQADLQEPETVTQAVKMSGAKRAFIYLVHGAPDHLQGAILAMKAAGIEFVVLLSSFTILTNQPLRDIPPSELLAHVHGQVEANLHDTFGPDHYTAVRSGCFATNLLAERSGIVANDVKLYGGTFEQDNIVPSDIGKVIGNILVSGPRNGQNNIVYLYGPKIRSIHESIVTIGKVLGKDLSITTLGPKEGYDNYITHGMTPQYAEFMVRTLSTKGPDKGHGERFPRYEEGVSNVKLYTGKPATTLDDWVKENKVIFET
ncbi:uncharacterized protein JN550_006844 [Neoarthrinium moseri]|uniref:uncharacterized protein n=1 Tax=Neoarthrinium moseri TaxID=1658444 RepID=UPI001FDD303F|nr:uncharacterized protein JN550_006844 [Neoarthrinium moseri]KAI1867703.1 hypothetical protein JN550_006844 [Neoarthrinium moseri]